jgi:hypothetical protein
VVRKGAVQWLILAASMIFFGAGIVGCASEGTFEEAGEDIDEAVDAVDDATDEIEDEFDDARRRR